MGTIKTANVNEPKEDSLQVKLREMYEDLQDEKDDEGNPKDNSRVVEALKSAYAARQEKPVSPPITGPAIHTEEYKAAEQASKDSLKKDEPKSQK